MIARASAVGNPFGVLVPQSDADGNDLGGVRLPELQVPLATSALNLRDPGIGAPDQRVSFIGSWIPLAKTAEERKKSGDPRPSIAERYASRAAYMSKFEQAAKKLVEQRFLLQEDLPEILERGKLEWKTIAEDNDKPDFINGSLSPDLSDIQLECAGITAHEGTLPASSWRFWSSLRDLKERNSFAEHLGPPRDAAGFQKRNSACTTAPRFAV